MDWLSVFYFTAYDRRISIRPYTCPAFPWAYINSTLHMSHFSMGEYQFAPTAVPFFSGEYQFAPTLQQNASHRLL